MPALLRETAYRFEYTYTDADQLQSIQYPAHATEAPIKIVNAFDSAGYHRAVTDPAGKQVYWAAQRATAAGHVVAEWFGNGLTSLRSVDSLINRPMSIQVRPTSTQADAADHTLYGRLYDWRPEDAKLRFRKDTLNAQAEEFIYDRLGRLRLSTVTQETQQFPRGTEYDALGNITRKDNEVYHYDAQGRLVTIEGSTPIELGYDHDGHVTRFGNTTLTYTSFGKVRTIRSPHEDLSFLYDAAGDRVGRIEKGSTTITLQDLYQLRIMRSGKTVETRYRIPVGTGRIGAEIISKRAASTPPVSQFDRSVHYFHDNYLGSTHTVTSGTGTVEEAHYDLWGCAYESDDWTARFNGDLRQVSIGFTGHPAELDGGFLNTGGRLYDCETGRFLSPDSIVADILDGQTYNRYSYVANQPDVRVDPSGYQAVDGFEKDSADEICREIPNCSKVTITMGPWWFPPDPGYKDITDFVVGNIYAFLMRERLNGMFQGGPRTDEGNPRYGGAPGRVFKKVHGESIWEESVKHLGEIWGDLRDPRGWEPAYEAYENLGTIAPPMHLFNVVLYGLHGDYENAIASGAKAGIPFLGKIPVVGKLHGNNLNTTKPAQGYSLRDRDTGEILKFGETTRGTKRYSQKYLERHNAEMIFEAQGTKREMHDWQHQKIIDYVNRYGKKPALNKIFW
jgi:RHS repeat-associated protein